MPRPLHLSRQLVPFLILLGGLLLWWGAVALAPEPHEKVSNTLQEESRKIEQRLQEVVSVLQDHAEQPFTYLPKKYTYPYYIYTNEQPWFWSDYHLLPSYSLLKSRQAVQFLNMPDGQFLAFQQEVIFDKQPFHIFMLLPLQSSLFEANGGQRYNPAVFSSAAFSLSATRQKGHKPVYLSSGNEPLFWLSLAAGYPRGYEGLLEVAAWLVLIGFLGVALVFWLRAYFSIGLSAQRFLVFAAAFMGTRMLMLALDLPHRIYPLTVFNPQYYASSSINPSLGDYLLNVLFLLGLFLMLWPRRNFLISRLEAVAGPRLLKIGAFVWVLSVLLLHYYLMGLLFYHAQFSLDITQNIEVTVLKVLAWSVVAIVSIVFFLLTHPFLNWLRSRTLERKDLVLIVSLLVLWSMLLVWISAISLLLLPALILYYLLYRQLTRRTPAPKLNYSLFIYLFGAAIVCALSAALALQNQRKTSLLAEKERLASQVLTERDLVGEYLLHEAAINIQNDPYIVNRFLSPLFSKEGIEQKIRRQYLSRYFDKYDTSIRLFGLGGYPLSNQYTASYFSLQQQAMAQGEPTDLEGLYRFSGEGVGDFSYKKFVPVYYQQTEIGYVLLESRLKRYQPRTVYPELFSSQQLTEPIFERSNYAVFVDGELRFDAGEFDYLHLFPQDLLAHEQLYREGVFTEDYHHYALRGEGSKVVVVSSPAQPLSVIYSNFSFLLLFMLFLITVYVVGYLLFKRLSVRYLNFTTKIQLYLNFAIFLPLLIITASTLSLISQSYRQETEQQFFDTAESISRGISELLHDFQQGYIDREMLSNNLDRIARYTETDIHLFDTRGVLQATSQPAIYQKNYLAPFINPHAQAEIVEQRHRQTILTETVGRLQYRSAYVAVRSNSNGQLLGIVSVPFFDSGYMLQRQLSAIFSNIVSIFATLFLVFLLLLYFFSKELTAPLRYIADRLRLISLTGKNEPLSWPTEDEIGLLVREYNHMLLNLQASKEALSRSEKESAWREMAKQVAHEIKNPLTPMRLSLQHLNRRLQPTLEDGEKEKVNRSFQSILDQIDTLSDIATSFSAFAKMPAPRQEHFDVAAVLSRVVRLYTSDQHYQLDVDIPEGAWLVQGDEQLMQRTFNNLILNGIQAVPSERQPHLHIGLFPENGQKVLIKIKDNGTGIAETIRNKVFVPNFSTKNSGSGLGLAIAKRGIEHAGGRIWFESNTGQPAVDGSDNRLEAGTTFFIELPLVN
ncbi:ATP-binding protein [Cesiribacter sp. SM1]|uniref:sensor histidine kinase n=1 Tax=Cesiribacter sp. SM1 TaxID=2861196 RepID=UPI001CD67E8F|nr:ATP-binding protein [Cesiribacter sp. SM1]